MNMRTLTRILTAAAICTFAVSRLAVAQPLQAPAADDVDAPEAEVLQRGPVHEAFAEPFALDVRAEEPVIVPKRPPEPIEELPPEVRPEGENVQWYPGYWMWSVEQQDFIWVSGVWRKTPPGREWIPGRWEEVDGGWRWISGYWADAAADAPQFLPEPPPTLEVGPNGPAPAANYFWIPGCWTWTANHYAWRPGYWYQGQPGWIWTPDAYAWTPRGYLFVAGYWDYPLIRRGWLFAPVYWPHYHGVYGRLRYTPRYVVNSGLLLGNLFVSRTYRQYYFGHVDPILRNRYGLDPWFHGYRHGRGPSRYGYDPLLAYHRWQHHGRNPQWLTELRNDFQQRHGHGRGNLDDRLVRSTRQLADDPKERGRLTRLSADELKHARRRAAQRGASVKVYDRLSRGDHPIELHRGQQATSRAKAVISGNPETGPGSRGQGSAQAQLRDQVQSRLQSQQAESRRADRSQGNRGSNIRVGPAIRRPPSAVPQAGAARGADANVGDANLRGGRPAIRQQFQHRAAETPTIVRPNSSGVRIAPRATTPGRMIPHAQVPRRNYSGGNLSGGNSSRGNISRGNISHGNSSGGVRVQRQFSRPSGKIRSGNGRRSSSGGGVRVHGGGRRGR